MKGLKKIAQQIASRLRAESCVTDDHRLKQDARTLAILDQYPAWILAYEVEPLRAVFISSSMARLLEVPPGFVQTEDEYKTVHHCDMTTAYNRFQSYEYFHEGGTGAREHVGTIMLPDETPVFVDDLAIPLILDEHGKTSCYAHVLAERGCPSLVNAYAFCDPGNLTPKQKEVFRLLLMNWKNPQITKHLGISPKTLEKHITAILALTGQPHIIALLEKCSHSE